MKTKRISRVFTQTAPSCGGRERKVLFFLYLLPLGSPDARGRRCSALDSSHRRGDIRRTGRERGTRREAAWPYASVAYSHACAELQAVADRPSPKWESPGWTRRRGLVSKRMSGRSGSPTSIIKSCEFSTCWRDVHHSC